MRNLATKTWIYLTIGAITPFSFCNQSTPQSLPHGCPPSHPTPHYPWPCTGLLLIQISPSLGCLYHPILPHSEFRFPLWRAKVLHWPHGQPPHSSGAPPAHIYPFPAPQKMPSSFIPFGLWYIMLPSWPLPLLTATYFTWSQLVFFGLNCLENKGWREEGF